MIPTDIEHNVWVAWRTDQRCGGQVAQDVTLLTPRGAGFQRPPPDKGSKRFSLEILTDVRLNFTWKLRLLWHQSEKPFVNRCSRNIGSLRGKHYRWRFFVSLRSLKWGVSPTRDWSCNPPRSDMNKTSHKFNSLHSGVSDFPKPWRRCYCQPLPTSLLSTAMHLLWARRALMVGSTLTTFLTSLLTPIISINS